MSRVASLMFALALVTGACSGGSDGESPATNADPVATDTVADTEPEATTTTVPTTTTTSTTVAPTTTLDEAALLAEAEAAYLEAFEVGKEVIRNPDNPDNDELLREHFTDGNLEKALENLRLTIEGNFVSERNSANPSFVEIIEPAEFLDESQTTAVMTVCEFNSDKLYEIGAAPDGTDALVRDDPVSFLFVTRMELIDGQWKSKTGGEADEIRSEEEQCSAL